MMTSSGVAERRNEPFEPLELDAQRQVSPDSGASLPEEGHVESGGAADGEACALRKALVARQKWRKQRKSECLSCIIFFPFIIIISCLIT